MKWWLKIQLSLFFLLLKCIIAVANWISHHYLISFLKIMDIYIYILYLCIEVVKLDNTCMLFHMSTTLTVVLNNFSTAIHQWYMLMCIG